MHIYARCKRKTESTQIIIFQSEGTEVFEPVEEDEERVINIVINEKMEKSEIVNMILDAVRKYCKDHDEFNHYDV